MDVTAAIDQIVARTANVGSADADYSNLRTRVLEYLTQEFQWYWTARQWKWRRTSTTLTVTANSGAADLPTNFGSIGPEGGVWNTSNGKQLEEVSEDMLREIKEQPLSGTSDPDFFSLYGQNTSDYTLQLQTENNTASLSLKVSYNKIPPTLSEEASEVNNIKQLPSHYHQSVIIPALRSHILWAKGDASWQDHEQQRLRGLDHMMREERRRQGSARQLPSFFGGRL
jgi:hypothetical protein